MKRISIAMAVVGAGCGASGTAPSNDPPTWGVPISGGNLIISTDGTHAFVADPDRDRLIDVDLTSTNAVEIPLTAGDEPGRLVQDAAGRVQVALRRGGALVTIQNDQVIARRAVCAEPRGVAYEAATDLVHVACSTGELVSLPAAGGDATRNVFIDRDLRDVLVRNGTLYVTRFRAAELIQLDANGAIVARVTPPTEQRFDFNGDDGGGISDGSGDSGGTPAIPAVAWRTILTPSGSILMSHQRQLQTILSTVTHGGYGQGCGGPVEPDLTFIDGSNAAWPMLPIDGDALPVDIAVNSGGTELAVAYAAGQVIQRIEIDTLTGDNGTPSSTVCPDAVAGGGDGTIDTPIVEGGLGTLMTDNLGAPTSVAYTPSNQVVVYYPELPGLALHNSDGSTQIITLPGDVGYDAGRTMFHQQTPSGLACASCHPEAQDDGLVWNFDTEGVRRTQNVAGEILARAPYHWVGDEPNLPVLMDDVFGNRMGGAMPSNSEHESLGPWLDRVAAHAPLAGVDPAAAARGQTLFQSTAVGCTTCHAGSLMSTKAIVDVGTGGAFKVPSLIGVNGRAPYMHTGCAATLLDRFNPACGGGDMHGHTSQLTSDQLNDLVAYLETL
ncbi:MAG TPA: cytochrome c [Kofleriaceae bacterium]